MGSGFDATYFPEKEKVEVYKKLYEKYLEFGKFIENKS
jgi:L-ribulokinase